jgi:uncharacterized protein with NRDE domain
MAKVKGPLMSLGASGTIAGAMTFSSWKGIPTARIKSTPTNPNTAGQQAQRTTFGLAVASWKAQDEADQLTWTNRAKALGLKMSGFNLYTREYIKQGVTDPAVPTLP